ITFTDKAKKEMFDKIFEMAKGKFSDSSIMKLNIHTFHSFAYNYLVDSGLVTGNIVGNNVMRYSILRSFENNKAFHYSKDYIISDIVPKTENAIRYIKSFGITPDKIVSEKAIYFLDGLYDENKTSYSLDEMRMFLKYFVDAYKNYEDSKQEAIDYSDMLLIFIEKFRGKKFQHVLVDEMQDMNELEAKISQMIGETLFLVGDAKQAIFGFQGGSVKNFNKFMETCEPKLLSMNRRSCQEILDYSKGHFLGKTKYKEMFERELEYFKSQGNGQVPKVISTSAHLSKILDVIEDNPEKTIGVITRTNRQIIEISRYLDTNNIKYSSTSAQATAEQAKVEILSFVKGLVSDRIEDKISASFTIFSPYSLKEAFELSSAFKKKENGKLEKIKTWGISMKREDLDGIFDKVVFPLCVSRGAEWFSTAISVKQQIDQYLALNAPTVEGLFDFIAISEESYIERSAESKITLTTVHKAKGRAFDVVVYLPSSARRTSFIDIIVEAILASNGIDIKEELEEESLRIDFVAFTRAKEKLVIITDDKNSKNYHIERLSEIEVDDRQDELVATRLNSRLSEAFSLFVAGRFQDSEKLLKGEDGWLEEFILNYFKNIDHFSYSSIKPDPYEFLIENIIKIPVYYAATDFGSKVHSALADVFTDRAKVEDFEGDVKKAVENGMNAINQLKTEFPGLKIVAVEKGRRVPLRSMIEYDDQSMMFTGFIDAVFQHDNGYLIVDYKTDKNSNYVSDHKRQLSVYRKMHSILEEIPEDKISTCVVFVALRGGINTGKFDWSIEMEKRNAFPTFAKHLQTVLEWKKNPKKFIQDFLNDPRDDVLYNAIKEKLIQYISKP
ncbi:MAG: ATP-dependent helicase, partial [Candidatus Nitrosotenuis sp.]